MKKILLPFLMLFFVGALSFTASAQNDAGIYFEEVFDYEAGSDLVSDAVASAQNLDATTGWSTRSNSSASTTIYTIASSPLFYDGYPLSGIGKAVNCDGESGQTVYKNILESDVALQVVEEYVYFSFLINMPKGQTVSGGDYFFGIKNATGASSSNTVVRTRAIIEDDQITYGAAHYSKDGPFWGETTFPAGETQLVVIKYYNGTVDNKSDDHVYMFINPDMTTEPSNEDAYLYIESDGNDYDAYAGGTNGLYGINFRSATFGKNPAFDMSGIRVATSYDALFSEYTGDLEAEEAPTSEVVLTPTDDTYYYKTGTSSNYGAEETLLLYHTSSAEWRAVTYLKYDISALTSINDVTLRLYTDGIDATDHSASHTLNVIPVTYGSDWDETTLIYDNFKTEVGATLTDILATNTVAQGSVYEAQYMEFSGDALTQLFQDSLAAGAQYVTVLLREASQVTLSDGSTKVFVAFHSKENTSGNAPQLVVSCDLEEDTTVPDADTETEAEGLIPTDDTYVYCGSGDGSGIYGMEDIMEVRYSTASTIWIREAFVKFDIISLSTQIENVTFKLYTESITADGVGHNFQIHPVLLNSWAEDGISYNDYTTNCGASQSTVLASCAIAGTESVKNSYIEFTSDALTQIVIDSLEAGCRYISFRIAEATASSSTTTIEFHTKENASGNAPLLVVVEKDVELIKAAEICVDGTPLADFSDTKYSYTYELDWDATVIPTVTATAKYAEATVSVAQATSLVGTDTECIAVVSITNGGETLDYKVVFELGAPPTEARLDAIYLDGVALEYFDTDTYTYTSYLPYTRTAVPVITATNTDSNASYTVVDASSMDAADAESARTATISSTSANGEVFATYTVVFEQLPKLDLILSIGQSNMAGRAGYEDYTADMEGVFISTDAGGMEVASNPLNKYSNIRKDISLQGLSPAYKCLVDVQAAVGEKIGYVGNSQGGSSITLWYQPGCANYDSTMVRALRALEYGEYSAIIWHQGESDKSGNFETYKTRMATMVANLRADLNSPDLFFICGELSQKDDRIDFNEQVIQTVADYIDNSDWVSTEGTALLSDDTHFDTESVILLGGRYGEKVLEHVYPDAVGDAIENNVVTPAQFYTSQGTLYIDQKDASASFLVYDTAGTLLQTGALSTGLSTIDMPYANGVYIVTVVSNQATYVEKVIIK